MMKVKNIDIDSLDLSESTKEYLKSNKMEIVEYSPDDYTDTLIASPPVDMCQTELTGNCVLNFYPNSVVPEKYYYQIPEVKETNVDDTPDEAQSLEGSNESLNQLLAEALGSKDEGVYVVAGDTTLPSHEHTIKYIGSDFWGNDIVEKFSIESGDRQYITLDNSNIPLEVFNNGSIMPKNKSINMHFSKKKS